MPQLTLGFFLPIAAVSFGVNGLLMRRRPSEVLGLGERGTLIVEFLVVGALAAIATAALAQGWIADGLILVLWIAVLLLAVTVLALELTNWRAPRGQSVPRR